MLLEKAKSIQVYFLAASICTLSCTNSKKGNDTSADNTRITNSHDAAGGNSSGMQAGKNTYSFKLQLQPGQRYYYTVNNETDFKLEYTGRKVENSNSLKVSMYYEVLKAGADTVQVKLTYDKFYVVSKRDGEKQVMDTEKPEAEQDQAESILSKVKGSSIVMTLTSDGKLLNIDGVQAITDKMIKEIDIYGNTDPEGIAAAKAQASSILGENFIKSNLKNVFSVSPGKPVAEGDSWSAKGNQSTGGFNFDAETIYKLTDLDAEEASIEANTAINSSNATMEMGASKATAEIKGSTKASFEINRSTGLPSSGESVTKLTGVVTVLARQVPVEIYSKRKITIKQL